MDDFEENLIGFYLVCHVSQCLPAWHALRRIMSYARGFSLRLLACVDGVLLKLRFFRPVLCVPRDADPMIFSCMLYPTFTSDVLTLGSVIHALVNQTSLLRYASFILRILPLVIHDLR